MQRVLTKNVKKIYNVSRDTEVCVKPASILKPNIAGRAEITAITQVLA